MSRNYGHVETVIVGTKQYDTGRIVVQDIVKGGGEEIVNIYLYTLNLVTIGMLPEDVIPVLEKKGGLTRSNGKLYREGLDPDKHYKDIIKILALGEVYLEEFDSAWKKREFPDPGEFLERVLPRAGDTARRVEERAREKGIEGILGELGYETRRERPDSLGI